MTLLHAYFRFSLFTPFTSYAGWHFHFHSYHYAFITITPPHISFITFVTCAICCHYYFIFITHYALLYYCHFITLVTLFYYYAIITPSFSFHYFIIVVYRHAIFITISRFHYFITPLSFHFHITPPFLRRLSLIIFITLFSMPVLSLLHWLLLLRYSIIYFRLLFIFFDILLLLHMPRFAFHYALLPLSCFYAAYALIIYFHYYAAAFRHYAFIFSPLLLAYYDMRECVYYYYYAILLLLCHYFSLILLFHYDITLIFSSPRLLRWRYAIIIFHYCATRYYYIIIAFLRWVYYFHFDWFIFAIIISVTTCHTHITVTHYTSSSSIIIATTRHFFATLFLRNKYFHFIIANRGTNKQGALRNSQEYQGPASH